MNSFLSNSTYRITFAANNYETANLISFEKLYALYEINGNHTKEDEVDLQGYNSADDDFAFVKLECNTICNK